MVLDVPNPGVTPGPTYAVQISNDLNIIDAHDHALGAGAPIPLVTNGGLYEDASQHLGVLLDGASIVSTVLGLKVNSLSGVLVIGAPTAATAEGLALSGATLSSTPADATHPGHVTTGIQTFAGAKTFTGALTASAGITSDSVTSTSGQLLHLLGFLIAADAGTDVVVESTNTRTSGNIFKVRNNTVDLLSVDWQGIVSALSINNLGDYHQVGGTLSSDSLLSQSAATLTLTGAVADGASAVAFTLNSLNAISAVGSKLLSLQNATVEKFYVDFSGLIAAPALDTLAAGTLALGGIVATEVDIGRVGQPVSVLGNLLSSMLDTAAAGTLALGGTTATEVDVGRSGQPVSVLGNLLSSMLDRAAAGTLAIGGTTATEVDLGRSGQPVSVLGNLLSLTLDTAAAGTLALGGTTATEVDVGRSGMPVSILGNLLSLTLDTAAAGTLAVGGTTATEVDLGRSGQAVKVLGNLQSVALDTAAAGTLALGGTTATEVDVGRSGQSVKILGNLDPAATAAISVFGTNVASAGSPQAATQYLGSDGYVSLAGHLVSTAGTVTAGSTLATLDAAYRPNRTIILPVVDDLGAAGSITITTGGVVTCTINLVNATNEIPLDAMRYKLSN
jgi:hypothetical protein